MVTLRDQQPLRQCRFCEKPSCTKDAATDVRGIMRRVAAGNFVGARRAWLKAPADLATLEDFEKNCICAVEDGESIAIKEIVSYLNEVSQ